MESVHQGYLLCNLNLPHTNGLGETQKVYAVLNQNELICYSENPTLQHQSRVGIIATFSLKGSKIIESTDSNRPKSFQVESLRDGLKAEFSCPTNSVKFQWVKNLQVQTCMIPPSPAIDRINPNKHIAYNQYDEPMGNAPTGGDHALSINVNMQPISKLTASRNLAAKVLTPVPRISYNTSMLDHSQGQSGTSGLGNSQG